MYESFSHTYINQSNIVLITKIPFCISLKYLKMYSIVFFFFFFAKSCFNMYFNNHNNINMNDIQNSNNYSHIITLPSEHFSHTSVRLALQSGCIKRVCTPSAGLSFTLAYTECKARDLLTRQATPSIGNQRGVCAFVVRARYLSPEVSEEV